MLEVVLLIVDGMLVMLIWMVQLIVYPAFRDIESERFAEWHTRYMRMISVLVVPTMLGQLALISWLVFTEPEPWRIGAAVCVMVAWGATGLGAAPIHTKLQATPRSQHLLDRLLLWNLVRAVAWTIGLSADFLAFAG